MKSFFEKSVPIGVLSAFLMVVGANLAPAYGEDSVRIDGGQIGGGVTASTSTSAGSTAGAAAYLGGYAMGIGNRSALYGAIGGVQYNALGGGSNGFTTGLSGRVQFFTGGTLLPRDERGCDVYFGLGGSANASVHSQRPGDSVLSKSIGPETGLVCQVGKVLVMASPTVGFGAAASLHPGDADRNSANGGANLIGVGGRARLAVQDYGMVMAEVITTPQIADGSDAKSTEAKVEGVIRVNEKLNIGGYFRGTSISKDDGKPYAGAEGGVMLLRAF